MKLKIDNKIFERFPDLILGVASINNINNNGDNPEISNLLRESEEQIMKNLANTLIIEHPQIIPWREAYRKFGAKPKDYPSSIENLLRRTVKGQQVRHINKLVDIYNIISLKYLLPVGGEDISKIKGDIFLTYASSSETPVTLLGESEPRPPHPGEVIYKDDIGILCRRWNWKEADRTKLTEETKNAVIVIEGLPPVDKTKIQEALRKLDGLIKKYCGGEINSSVLDKTNPQFEL
ncbi:hypothetical protein HYW41_04020 [Candidatus Daviesbacteria bacterium]|nr:hypothetical protein [Candidatus Daviesbacteria bacterium]